MTSKYIAVLEDNPAICEYLTTALEMAGHRVSAHTHGASLLATLFTESGIRWPLPYDLVTADLLLAGELSGLEVIARIRTSITPAQLPIIMLSGAGDGLLEQAKCRFPQSPLLRKPFQMKALLQLIEDLSRSTR